jgi:hypothetical protein
LDLTFASLYISIGLGLLVIGFLCNLEASQPITKAKLAGYPCSCSFCSQNLQHSVMV